MSVFGFRSSLTATIIRMCARYPLECLLDGRIHSTGAFFAVGRCTCRRFIAVLTILGDASSPREMVTKRDPKRRHEKQRGSAGIRRAILREARIHRHRPSGVHIDMHYAADVARAIRLSTRSFRTGTANAIRQTPSPKSHYRSLSFQLIRENCYKLSDLQKTLS